MGKPLRPTRLFLSLAISFAAGGIGSLVTYPAIPTWYAALEKPGFNPPNWVFGPVWTILYILMGIALYLVWTSTSKKSKLTAYTCFGLQLALNALWSIVFFGLQQPSLAVGVIILLFATIVFTMMTFWRFSHKAAYLLAPYAAWVAFASALTIAVARLNA